MHTLKNIKLTNVVGAGGCLGLLLFGFMILSPPVASGAKAESAEIPVSVTSEDYLTLATTGVENATMKVTPAIDGSFVETPDIKLNITTNNPTGYKLLMATKSGESTLVNEASKDTIASIGGSVNEANFPMNHWGYKMTSTDINTADYHGIPTSNLTLDNRVQAAAEYNLNFAVRLDASKSGTYTNTVIFSAVANPKDVVTLADINKMQEMTTRICEDTPVESTKQLQDTRDNKWYWVAKLRDGRCWMTQNLDVDIPTTISEEFAVQSDNISTSWTPSAATIRDGHYQVGTDPSDSYSWDMGNYLMTNPSESEPCMFPEGTTLADGCPDKIQTAPDIAAADIPENVEGNTSLHYALGNYYQFNTAIANSIADTSMSNVDATGSICPQNWTLPKQNGDTSYGNLVNTYSIATPAAITAAPFYFVRSGTVFPRDAYFYNFHGAGYYWSHTNVSAERGSALLFGGDALQPSSDYERWNGFPIRCLAR